MAEQLMDVTVTYFGQPVTTVQIPVTSDLQSLLEHDNVNIKQMVRKLLVDGTFALDHDGQRSNDLAPIIGLGEDAIYSKYFADVPEFQAIDEAFTEAYGTDRTSELHQITKQLYQDSFHIQRKIESGEISPDDPRLLSSGGATLTPQEIDALPAPSETTADAAALDPAAQSQLLESVAAPAPVSGDLGEALSGTPAEPRPVSDGPFTDPSTLDGFQNNDAGILQRGNEEIQAILAANPELATQLQGTQPTTAVPFDSGLVGGFESDGRNTFFPGEGEDREPGFTNDPDNTIPPGVDPVNLPVDDRLQFLGRIPRGGFGTVDVRTPFMQALEQAIAPLMGQILENPFSFSQAAQGAAAQTPFGAGGQELLAGLFGQPNTLPQASVGSPGAVQTLLQGAGVGPEPGLPTPADQGRPGTPEEIEALRQLLEEQQRRIVELQTRVPNATLGDREEFISNPEIIQQFTNTREQMADLFQHMQAGGTSDTFTGDNPFNDPRIPTETTTTPFDIFNTFTGGAGSTGTQQPDASVVPNTTTSDTLSLLDRGNLINSILSGGTQFLQEGGILDPNALNIVGEAGPEAIIGDTVMPLTGTQQIQPISSLLGQNPELQSFENIQGFNTNLAGQDLTGQISQGLDPLINTGLEAGALSNTLGFNEGLAGIDIAGGTQQALQPLIGAPQTQQALQNTLGFNQQMGGTDLAGQATGALQPLVGAPETQGALQDTQLLNQLLGGRTGEAGILNALMPFGGINPEMDAFNMAQGFTQNLIGQPAGQGVIDAIQPLFETNLDLSLGRLRNTAPNVFGTGIATEGTDLARQSLQDFNLLAAQAALQGQQNQISGLNTFGQLAGQAGQNPFARALGGLGLASNVGLQQASQALQGAGLAGQQAVNADQLPFQQQFATEQLGTQTALQQIQQMLAGLGLAGQQATTADQLPFQQQLGAQQLGTQTQLQQLQTLLSGLGLAGQQAQVASQDPFARALGSEQLQAQTQLGQTGQQLSGLGLEQQSAQAAGTNPFARALSAGQFGLESQQQAFDQATNPTLQLLLAILGMGDPTALQTVGVPFGA